MTRITLTDPRTPLGRIAGWYIRRKLGVMPDPFRATAHHDRISKAYLLFEARAMRWNSMDAQLRDLAVTVSAVKIGCAWCVDFGSWELNTHGIPMEKIEAVQRWRDSDLFSPVERLVMEYAEAMTEDPPGVTDELTQALRRHGFDDEQLVELTMIVALENLRSRFNAAAGLTGQGFKDRCEVRDSRAI